MGFTDGSFLFVHFSCFQILTPAMRARPLIRRALTQAVQSARFLSSYAVNPGSTAPAAAAAAQPAILPSQLRSPVLRPALDGRPQRILGVETSCDDTALAILDTNG
jgi:hypothetical protein